ncbi:hypothetical protein BJ741DRAFT_196559 [Chytriomyces cf. hyalinus JEL632]|nr:hypothetical protein BJ741DRAFT_196559 [Chytriomyces cf. hyalinus JEL632]
MSSTQDSQPYLDMTLMIACFAFCLSLCLSLSLSLCLSVSLSLSLKWYKRRARLLFLFPTNYTLELEMAAYIPRNQVPVVSTSCTANVVVPPASVVPTPAASTCTSAVPPASVKPTPTPAASTCTSAVPPASVKPTPTPAASTCTGSVPPADVKPTPTPAAKCTYSVPPADVKPTPTPSAYVPPVVVNTYKANTNLYSGAQANSIFVAAAAAMALFL